MATFIHAYVCPVGHVRRRRRIPSIGAAALAVLLGGALLGSANGSAAGPVDNFRVCGERNALLEQFELKHHETPQALGLGADGGVIEILVSPEGGWTMLVTYPDRPTCVIAMGEGWQTLQLAGDPV